MPAETSTGHAELGEKAIWVRGYPTGSWSPPTMALNPDLPEAARAYRVLRILAGLASSGPARGSAFVGRDGRDQAWAGPVLSRDNA